MTFTLLTILQLLLPDPVAIISTNPASFSLHYLYWDPVKDATNYGVYATPMARRTGGRADLETRLIEVAAGIVMDVSTNFTTTNLWGAIQHLGYGQVYWLQVSAYGYWGMTDLSPALEWPPPLVTYDPLMIESSTNMSAWKKILDTGTVLTNIQPVFYRVSAARSNNIDSFQVKE